MAAGPASVSLARLALRLANGLAALARQVIGLAAWLAKLAARAGEPGEAGGPGDHLAPGEAGGPGGPGDHLADLATTWRLAKGGIDQLGPDRHRK